MGLDAPLKVPKLVLNQGIDDGSGDSLGWSTQQETRYRLGTKFAVASGRCVLNAMVKAQGHVAIRQQVMDHRGILTTMRFGTPEVVSDSL